jgi:exopolysaccharide biosynthesis polyprenyl glycosylphosphotransferase
VNDDYSRSSLGSDCEYYYSQHAATIDNVNHQEFVLDLSFGLIRRLFDILVGSLGLLCSVPFIVVFGLLTKIEDGGPVFYKQERVGLYGKHFTLYKLRSMRVNAEKNGPQWAEKDDPRVTRVGSFIRKTRIDELPQFYNVLRGDMTLVGPRPERPEFVIKFDQEIPGFISRLRVKPGLTGWAQINGGYDITPEEKLELDLFYIENRGPFFDFKILLKTVSVIFTGNGAR